MNPQQKSRLKLVAVIAVFVVPILVAYALTSNGWRPANLRNHGELVQPPVDVSAQSPIDAATGETVPWANQGGVFRLVMPAPAECGARCVETVDTLNGLWRGLGSDATRLEVFVTGDVDAATAEAVARFERGRVVRFEHPSMPARAEFVSKKVANDRGTLVETVGPVALYVVDPRGLVMLRYPPGYEIAGLRRDLTRLIR